MNATFAKSSRLRYLLPLPRSKRSSNWTRTRPEYLSGSYHFPFWIMLRNYCCCFNGSGTTDSADVADRDPVVLVSGIAGSILNSKPKKFGFETRVWVRILLADLEFRKKLWSIYNPETGSCFVFSLRVKVFSFFLIEIRLHFLGKNLFFFFYLKIKIQSFAGYTEPLDDSSEIVVPQDDYGLYAIDILDPSTVSPFLFLFFF